MNIEHNIMGFDVRWQVAKTSNTAKIFRIFYISFWQNIVKNFSTSFKYTCTFAKKLQQKRKR